ncbi:MAG TPA: hypothetical protein VH482_29405 [Thermomicrobiales bacterium]|jgi:hypothetical protein
MSSTDLEQYRAKAEELVQRAERDPAFAAQAKADPLGTLTAAGIPEDASRQMLAGGLSEVSGYRMSEGGCADTTCWVTACPGTCYVSI